MATGTVFYAWQSDTNPKYNRYFIRDACDQAIEELAAEMSVEDAPRLDHDTKGVAGMPDIIESIFEKIDRCSIFVPDLTIVAKTEAGKSLTNPNVMIELGRATGSVGYPNVVGVMNTAYGMPDELPFDISRRRHPIQYSLDSSNAVSKKQVIKELVAELKNAFKLILENQLPMGGDQSDSMANEIEAKQAEFESEVLSRQFHGFVPENGILSVCVHGFIR